MIRKALIFVILTGLALAGLSTLSLADQPSNHGATVSEVAKTTPPGPSHGQIVSAVAKTNSIKNYALSFDGVDDAVEIANSASFNINNSLSLEGLICVNGSNANPEIATQMAISKKDAYYFGVTPDFRFRGYVFGPGYWDDQGHWCDQYGKDTSFRFELGKWYYVAMTFDGSHLKYFVNGKQVDYYLFRGSIASSNWPIRIGDYSTNYREEYKFNGLIDEPRIWNRALNQEEIQANMYREISAQPGLVGYWKFNEGTGNIAHDSSGNGNDGTIFGDPAWVEGAPINN